MSEFHERLWPEEKDQPVLKVSLGEETYLLLWQNTWIQRYRTGIESYDMGLERYDHVIHKYSNTEDGNSNYVILTFEQIGPQGMDFLVEKKYAHHIDPLPDSYITDYIASQEHIDIPDSIPPEFDADAA